MAVESMVVLLLATALLVGLALYSINHRAEDKNDCRSGGLPD